MKKLVTFAFLVLVAWTAQGQMSAVDIVVKANDKLRGRSNYSEIKMSIVRPGWTREMEIKGWSLGEDYSLMIITAPARDKGVGFLKRGKEIWNWQPRIDRAVKLPPSMMNQSWMGSDLTNDDLVQQSNLVEDFTHKLLREEKVRDRMCYVVEMTPKRDAAIVWGKIVTWIDKEHFMQLETEFYDETDYLVNTMIGSDIRSFEGTWLPARLEVIPADEPGHKTVVEHKKIEFNIDLEPSFFTIQNIKSVH